MANDEMVVDVSRDWTSACDVQRRFMQVQNPVIDNMEYGARCRQLLELGGDCYDVFPLPDDRLAVAVGDASGKSLAAALMISNVQSSLRTAALLTGEDSAAVIRAVNRQVYSSSLTDRYATLFYGVFNGATGILGYVNAGHNAPLVVRRDGSILWLETGGAPLGIFPDWTYEEASVQLYPGDLIVAYTDGVTEAVNPAGEEWGIEGLRRSLGYSVTECADKIVREIFTAMDQFSQGRQSDDATIFVLKVH